MIAGRHAEAVAELLLNGKRLAVPALSLIQPTAVMRDHSEAMVDDGDVSAGPLGRGLVLQVDEGTAADLRGLVGLPGVDLPRGQRYDGAQP